MAPTAKAAAEAARRVAAVMALKDDAPTAPINADDDTAASTADDDTAATTEPIVALVRPTTTSGTDNIALETVQATVRMAETQHRHHCLAYESDTWRGLTADLADAERCLTDDRLVDKAIRDRMRRRFEAWDLQIPPTGDGGS